jgi:hypothetical protein
VRWRQQQGKVTWAAPHSHCLQFVVGVAFVRAKMRALAFCAAMISSQRWRDVTLMDIAVVRKCAHHAAAFGCAVCERSRPLLMACRAGLVWVRVTCVKSFAKEVIARCIAQQFAAAAIALQCVGQRGLALCRAREQRRHLCRFTSSMH